MGPLRDLEKVRPKKKVFITFHELEREVKESELFALVAAEEETVETSTPPQLQPFMQRHTDTFPDELLAGLPPMQDIRHYTAL